MISQRIIESAVGHRIALDILPGADGLRLSRLDLRSGDAVVLDARGARILSAFLGGAPIVNRTSRPPEEIEDAVGTVLTLHDEPAPMVRIAQAGRVLDVHSPSWEALRFEIDMMVARLDSTPIITSHSTSRH